MTGFGPASVGTLITPDRAALMRRVTRVASPHRNLRVWGLQSGSSNVDSASGREARDREAPPAVRPNTVAYRSLGNGETDLSR